MNTRIKRYDQEGSGWRVEWDGRGSNIRTQFVEVQRNAFSAFSLTCFICYADVELRGADLESELLRMRLRCEQAGARVSDRDMVELRGYLMEWIGHVQAAYKGRSINAPVAS